MSVVVQTIVRADPALIARLGEAGVATVHEAQGRAASASGHTRARRPGVNIAPTSYRGEPRPVPEASKLRSRWPIPTSSSICTKRGVASARGSPSPGSLGSRAAGDVLVIPGDAKHSGRAHTGCRILDVFSPVREEYR